MIEQKMTMKFVSLFSGAGGLDQGFIDAGWDPVFMVDNWQPAIDTLTVNHQGIPVYGWDLSNINVVDKDLKFALSVSHWNNYPNHEIHCVIGGFPCQALTRLNNNQLFEDGKETEYNLNDPRRSLFMSFLHVVNRIKPRFVVMENVADLKTRKLGGNGLDRNRLILDVILEEFDKAGYNTVVSVLRAQDFNVPQMRKRIVFIGARKDLNIQLSMPAPMPLATSVAIEFAKIRQDDPNQDQKAVSTDWITKVAHIPQGGYYNHLPLKHKVLKPVKKTMLCGADLIKKTVCISKGYCFKTPDGNYYEGEIAAKVLNFGGLFYKISPRMGTYLRRIKETVSHTVTRNPLIHPTENRELTVREKAAIQTFPPWYQFMGKIQDQHVLVGNAVPCNLGKAIAEHIKRWLP